MWERDCGRSKETKKTKAIRCGACYYSIVITRIGCTLLTCNMYMSDLRHIHDPVFSSLKMKGILFLITLYIRLSNCHISLLYIKPILTTSFTYEIFNYLSSPQITFFPALEIQLFGSRSLPLVNTYVGRDWFDCTNATAQRNFFSDSDSHPMLPNPGKRNARRKEM
jgi:hypothetical protein